MPNSEATPVQNRINFSRWEIEQLIADAVDVNNPREARLVIEWSGDHSATIMLPEESGDERSKAAATARIVAWLEERANEIRREAGAEVEATMAEDFAAALRRGDHVHR